MNCVKIWRHDCSTNKSVETMQLPDDKLIWNEEREHYDFCEINWEEFWNVVKETAHVIKSLEARRKAKHEEGEWVEKQQKPCCKKKIKRSFEKLHK